MKSPDVRLGIGFLVLAITLLALASTISDEWRRSTLAGDEFITVGPRFFPVTIAALMALLATLLIVSSRGKVSTNDRVRDGRSMRPVLAFLVIAVAYVAAFPSWGLLAAPFCLGAAYFYFGVRGWSMLVLVPVLVTALMFLCFERLMQIPLP
jgi:putative tricarboxylic transport membrane protein